MKFNVILKQAKEGGSMLRYPRWTDVHPGRNRAGSHQKRQGGDHLLS